jgi:hypothetical protein
MAVFRVTIPTTDRNYVDLAKSAWDITTVLAVAYYVFQTADGSTDSILDLYIALLVGLVAHHLVGRLLVKIEPHTK